MGKVSDWEFTRRFRRGGFGWRASRLARERIAEAPAEIRVAARRDPLHAADGAVRFLVKLSPAPGGRAAQMTPVPDAERVSAARSAGSAPSVDYG